ncbi:conserved hypothetical protein [Desulforamulus hydrothermalis Lam5 = DSM 18033]|uniref:Uncharacterized protein n=1 Tax=Desulforamulus hydrothermalis Lam5 = DSM 18033 TaxID=1121428 RepID=K8DXT8_9FIRM|nr:hypothetical protein [Desulforamulus hydrothermalis]CCO07459.1 conserved hypothetical protein [Desulforamulus hydrothermalis Lam5 = DSM 18033]SHH18036.1 hypothetical protein SAMN02745177_01735 [Desulforamulus hydrothermalis Lam5 = DSM 18033]
MTDISIRLSRVDSQAALQQVDRALNRLGSDDELTIVMEAADAHQSEEISNLLAKHHFDFQPVGSHNGNNYILKARRKTKI